MGWGIAQIVLYVVLLTLIAKPLGTYMAHVFRGEHTFMDRVVRPVEKLTYRLCGIDETREMGVTGYAVSLVVFNLAVLLFIYSLAAVIRRHSNPASISYNPCTAAAFCNRSVGLAMQLKKRPRGTGQAPSRAQRTLDHGARRGGGDL